MKTRTIEYFRCWEDHTWDTDFIEIPSDTIEEQIETAVREAAQKIDWVGEPPVFVGVYNTCEDDSDEEEEEELETTMVCGKTLYRRKCQECGVLIWSQFKTHYVACDDCILPKGTKDFDHDTGGGTRINRKGSIDS